jgi:hypothetical protein
VNRLHPVAYAAAFATLVLHLAFNHRFGYYRDELYFIDCARHLSWRYVDQPPLVPLLVWLTGPAGYAVWALRLAPALFASITVLLACATARELRGGAFAQAIAGIGAALAPGLLGLGYGLSTEVLSPAAWTALVYCTLRLVRTRDERWYAVMALIVIVAFYAKYSILACVLSIAIGLLLTGRGGIFRSVWFAGASAIVLVLIAPNVWWQASHHFPMLDVIAGDRANRHSLANGIADESSSLLVNAGFLIAGQLLYMNVFLSPIWIAGLIATARGRLGGDARFIAVGYCVLLCIVIVTVGRPYYAFGMYPALFAAGGVALEMWSERRSRVRVVIGAAALVAAAAFVPIALPVVPFSAYLRYESFFGLSRISASLSPDHQPRLMNPLYADQLGWNAMTKTVALAYYAIPQPQRSHTAIFADRYAYAGAIDFYGPRYGLPRVISPNNQYYLWGVRGYSGESMLAVGATDYRLLLRAFGRVRQVAVYRNDYRWVLEGPLPIYLCTQPKAPLIALWPAFKYYGL